MPKFIDRTGTVVNGITFIKRVPNKGKKVMWEAQCPCGNHFIDSANHLISGRSVSCPECGRKRIKEAATKHGDYKNPLYAVWTSMKQRCYNPKAQEYKNYGGRGITVTPEWMDWLTFKEWAVSHGYEKGLSIERKDVNGNYEPSNCTWITLTQQAYNKRSNHLLTFRGETKTATEFAKQYGFRPCVVLRRLSRGWSTEKTLTTPLDLSRIHLSKSRKTTTTR